MRYLILDGFRGWFLIFMTITHVGSIISHVGSMTGGTLRILNHHSFGWVEDAQGFVFLSGAVFGLVDGRRLLSNGFAPVRAAAFRRSGVIYAHQVVIILLAVAGALALLGAGFALDDSPEIMRPYLEAPGAFGAASLALVASSEYMDILPMYIFLLLLAPFLLQAFARGHAASVLVISALIWTLAQMGLLRLLTALIEGRLESAGIDIQLGHYFNVLAWQILFVAGLFLGFQHAAGRLDLSFLRRPAWIMVFRVCLVAIALFALDDMAVWRLWLPESYLNAEFSTRMREDFGPVHMANFAVDLFALTWLLYAAETCAGPVGRTLGRGLHWLFTRRPLVFLGQHSLQVFSFHVLVIYLAAFWLTLHPPETMLERNAPMILAALSLYLPAWLHAGWQRASRARQAGETAAV